jgi:hypothetical protein
VSKDIGGAEGLDPLFNMAGAETVEKAGNLMICRSEYVQIVTIAVGWDRIEPAHIRFILPFPSKPNETYAAQPVIRLFLLRAWFFDLPRWWIIL